MNRIKYIHPDTLKMIEIPVGQGKLSIRTQDLETRAGTKREADTVAYRNGYVRFDKKKHQKLIDKKELLSA